MNGSPPLPSGGSNITTPLCEDRQWNLAKFSSASTGFHTTKNEGAQENFIGLTSKPAQETVVCMKWPPYFFPFFFSFLLSFLSAVSLGGFTRCLSFGINSPILSMICFFVCTSSQGAPQSESLTISIGTMTNKRFLSEKYNEMLLKSRRDLGKIWRNIS